MKRKPPLTPRQRVSVLNAAIQHVEAAHGALLGIHHPVVAQQCACEYGETVRGLKSMRREAYAAVQVSKKEVAK